jgi:exodeoxyribonuclease VII large subunit
MLNTLRRRYTLCRVVLAPTQVQGDDAPPGIVAAIAALNRICQPDVILVCRGGGSIEDLWAFNDERVARAIAASAAPIISGVGHETDFTIADFVSDLRAPTPTAAAELATPNRLDLKAYLDDSASRLTRVMRSNLEARRWSLTSQEHRLALHSPRSRVLSGRQRLDDLTHRAGYALSQRLALHQAHLTGLEQRLACLNPLSVLGRGFSLVLRQDGSLVRSVAQVQPGEDLNVRVSDGAFGVRVRPAASGGEDQTSTLAGTQGGPGGPPP